ncbi:OadG family protein [Chloroflexota bacterium]
MKDVGFGLTMTVMGMGVTFITLYLLTLVIRLLIRLFPYKAEEKGKSQTGT